jgi:hypothetical protein
MDTDRKFAIRGGPTIYNRLRPFEVICITWTEPLDDSLYLYACILKIKQ